MTGIISSGVSRRRLDKSFVESVGTEEFQPVDDSLVDSSFNEWYFTKRYHQPPELSRADKEQSNGWI